MDLRSYLAAEKISLAKFGERVGVESRQTMWRYVSGLNLPPPDVMKRIREVTDGRVTDAEMVDFAAAVLAAGKTSPAGEAAA